MTAESRTLAHVAGIYRASDFGIESPHKFAPAVSVNNLPRGLYDLVTNLLCFADRRAVRQDRVCCDNIRIHLWHEGEFNVAALDQSQCGQ